MRGQITRLTILLHSLIGALCRCRRWGESWGTLILRLVCSKGRLMVDVTCRRDLLSKKAVRKSQAGSEPHLVMEDLAVYRCLASMDCCPGEYPQAVLDSADRLSMEHDGLPDVWLSGACAEGWLGAAADCPGTHLPPVWEASTGTASNIFDMAWFLSADTGRPAERGECAQLAGVGSRARTGSCSNAAVC